MKNGSTSDRDLPAAARVIYAVSSRSLIGRRQVIRGEFYDDDQRQCLEFKRTQVSNSAEASYMTVLEFMQSHEVLRMIETSVVVCRQQICF